MIQTILLLILFAFIQAALTKLLDFCFQPGNIFEGYLKFIEKHLGSRAIAKPLGLCVFCFNIWIALGFFLILWGAEILGLVWYIPFAAVSHFWLSFIHRL